MKKSVFTLALALGVSSVFAQDLTSKKGEAYLPEAGDWAIGIDATPFLNYFGNFFGKTGPNGAPSFNFLTTNQTITGKYFVESGMAYRGSIRLGFNGNKMTDMVANRGVATAPVYPAVPEMVENEMKMSTTNIGIGGGLEWRKGTTRLQGFYGADLGIGFNSTKTTYSYGNALTATTAANPVAVDPADDIDGTNLTTDTYGNAARVTEFKAGSTFGVGLRGFIGAEYFVLPKLAVGGEFGWGLVFTTTGTSSTTVESVGTDGAGNSVVGTQTTEGGKTSSFGVDTQNNNSIFGAPARLSLTLYF